MENSFKEYVNSHGKIGKPIVDISGDQIDPKTMPNKPPKADKPYAVKDTAKQSKKPFGNQGDSDLVYEPATDEKSKGKAPAKIPTVEQFELAGVVADAIHQDISVVESLIYTLKKRGLLGPLVAELFEHRTTYNILSDIMSHKEYGPEVCDKLTEAMAFRLSEEVAPPFSDQLDASGEDEIEGEDDEFSGDDMGAEDDVDIDLSSDEEPGEGDLEDPNGMDPNMMGGDPNMMGMDPSMDPNMMGGDPNMMGAPPGLPAAMRHFQKAYMRAYQRAMMRKGMRKA